MKNKIFIGIVLIIIAIVALITSVIWHWVFNLMNPDMTELRLLIENPYPTIIAIASTIGLMIGRVLMEEN
jgi:hypothetical protein